MRCYITYLPRWIAELNYTQRSLYVSVCNSNALTFYYVFRIISLIVPKPCKIRKW